MAKAAVGPVKNEKYLFPSLYGSHASMIIGERDDGCLVLKDEFGEYWTWKDRIDNKLADPSRYSSSHRIVKNHEELRAVEDRWGPGAVLEEQSAKNLNTPSPKTVNVND